MTCMETDAWEHCHASRRQINVFLHVITVGHRFIPDSQLSLIAAASKSDRCHVHNTQSVILLERFAAAVNFF